VDYILLWLSLALTAAAVVLSLVLWRREREHLVLLMTGLLVIVFSHCVEYAYLVLWRHDGTVLEGWMLLVASLASLAMTIGAGRVMGSDRRRGRAIEHVQAALNEAEQGLSEAIGGEFFRHGVHALTKILNVESAFIAELREDGETADVIALSVNGEDGELFAYELATTPCAEVVGKEARAFPRDVQDAFPDDELLVDFNAQAYIGVPLFGAADRPLGVLAVVHSKPIEDPAPLLPAMRIIAARAEAELDRKQQDQVLRDSEQRYRELFEESLDAHFVTNADGKMIDINRAGVELFGYQTRDQLLEEFVADEHYSDYTERGIVLGDLARDGRVRDYPIEVRRRDGSKLTVRESAVIERDADGNVLTIRGTLRDVTREHELQRQLMSSQRMEALGRMAGGVAHDFNNMLTVINGHSDLLLDELDPQSATAQDVQEIKKAASSAAAFTRRLLLLSSRKVLAPGRMNLNELVAEHSTLLQKAVGEDVVMTLELEPDLADVIADATEMEQVLLNLVINSRDAMPGGGKLTVATRYVELGDWEAIGRGLEGGSWVELLVTDEGQGIEPEILDHIFEPFFTTKDPMIGTGLGLSTVYGIIRQLGGDIGVESTPGKGTAFSLLIPPVLAEEEGAELLTIHPSLSRPQETLLVVDDEPTVLSLLQRSLERQGYQVLLAASGNEALERLKARGRVDLMITDMMMPGLRGDRLAVLARELQPDLPVLVISGNARAGEFDLESGAPAAFLGKPFSTLELNEQVRGLLDQGEAA